MSCRVCRPVFVAESRCIEVSAFLCVPIQLFLNILKQPFFFVYFRIFGTEGEEAENVMYTTWLNMLWAGSAKALEMYSPASKKWLQVRVNFDSLVFVSLEPLLILFIPLQSHSQARYVILQVCLEAGEDFVKVTETEPGKNLLLSVDRSKIKTVGKKAIGDFLVKLQVIFCLINMVVLHLNPLLQNDYYYF